MTNQTRNVIPQHINNASDLTTPHEKVRAGFLEQALAKTEKSQPYLDEALHFKAALHHEQSIDALVHSESLRPQLITASGFSAKAQAHLSEQEIVDALKRMLEVIAEKASDDWRDEIMYRYLLIKGASLDGSMRNLTGAMAAERFSKAILAALDGTGEKMSIRRSDTDKIQSIKWDNRLLVFDRTPPTIKKNIDAILIDTSSGSHSEAKHVKREQDFIALGELKGGIDPAGADEHWKTANSALNRIRTAFNGSPPPLFFIGAAIEASMAQEIYGQLQSGELSHAANLTSPQQLADLASWLVTL